MISCLKVIKRESERGISKDTYRRRVVESHIAHDNCCFLAGVKGGDEESRFFQPFYYRNPTKMSANRFRAYVRPPDSLASNDLLETSPDFHRLSGTPRSSVLF